MDCFYTYIYIYYILITQLTQQLTLTMSALSVLCTLHVFLHSSIYFHVATLCPKQMYNLILILISFRWGNKYWIFYLFIALKVVKLNTLTCHFIRYTLLKPMQSNKVQLHPPNKPCRLFNTSLKQFKHEH